ncbi:Transcriptional regulator, TetR family [Pseudonocardia sp. Ae168_Ps1]|uniref:TetR/AcrR family transcriptional regulator n=1 Tax=unclassified Pseudonocardia TaxID=2619320 RepID=UPI00094B6794|nr:MULTISPECIES: TetR/AcrR family transcriptional regulator [unclassified Pseudonocardia]OLL72153.1 Transcriptional regulator, TetR family [Pseudonocardia sp. Ae150A_Ps1]OLL78120.1 Transcriptional regulator, TetR family [Pseudonocardia sp. Ae168_Ps1]OLL87756.1 Transcriptional regulator, TetR family [Pseudonocardia sp. Ae263_Ps1]OLL92218.1 Transcriptional regulator, TetR family [Pseudonocardia sp. Ae356_Ps1]
MEGTRDGRRRRGADTRRALVDSAVDVVTTGGFDRLTLREVASRAGVSPASASYHFGTVADLLAAVVAELDDRSTARLADLTRRSRAGELTLLDACTTYLVDLLGPGRRAYLTMLELRIRAARDPSRVAPPGGQDAVVDLIQDHLRNRDRARELFASVVGLATLGALDPAEPDPARIRDHMARLLDSHGLAREPARTAEGERS